LAPALAFIGQHSTKTFQSTGFFKVCRPEKAPRLLTNGGRLEGEGPTPLSPPLVNGTDLLRPVVESRKRAPESDCHRITALGIGAELRAR
jgi:hypothetical protein